MGSQEGETDVNSPRPGEALENTKTSKAAGQSAQPLRIPCTSQPQTSHFREHPMALVLTGRGREDALNDHAQDQPRVHATVRAGMREPSTDHTQDTHPLNPAPTWESTFSTKVGAVLSVCQIMCVLVWIVTIVRAGWGEGSIIGGGPSSAYTSDFKNVDPRRRP